VSCFVKTTARPPRGVSPTGVTGNLNGGCEGLAALIGSHEQPFSGGCPGREEFELFRIWLEVGELSSVNRLVFSSFNAFKRACDSLSESVVKAVDEGRTRAMANGVKFGRKRKLSDYQRAEAIKRRDGGETLAAIAKSYGVAISMISRL
jgi:hypothetical protein